MIAIEQAETAAQIQQVRDLFVEYYEWAQKDVDKVEELSTVPAFDDYRNELATLPGKFAPPEGRLLLATYGTEVAGCIALKKMREDVGASQLSRQGHRQSVGRIPHW